MLENLIYFDFNFNNNINNYVSIIIQGGLGNQLFQIGTAYTYSIENKKKLIFEYTDNLKIKSFWSTLFNNKLNVLNNNEYYNKFNNNEKKIYNYNEKSYDNNNILLLGSFQSFKYLENEKSTRNFLRHLVYSSENLIYETYELYNKIKKYFTNINNIECEDDDIVSMHFRRTDYNNYQNILDINYYINALKIVNRNNIVIFSDDIEWCKKNINNKVLDNEKVNIYFIDINNVELEFLLMSFIKHNIIANSKFSLMASYISYYESKKIIVAPKNWLSEIQIKSYDKEIIKSYDKEIEEIYHNDITNII
tara:strand:+ start:3648 stop:4568 length:921 start_codon:yes stop_codon:yes gene_type:complete